MKNYQNPNTTPQPSPEEEDMLFWATLLINDTSEYDMIDQIGW